jgi:pyridoxal phosphate enzyme (YggS family)
MSGAPASRREELAANLAALRERVDRACSAAGRSAHEIVVIAVTKTFPADDVRRLADLGVTDIGENRDQEAAPKAVACAELDLRWHFIGQLQSNKAPSVARYATVVHSVDRPRLVRALDRAADAASRRVACLVQVNLDASPAATVRGGASPEEVPKLAEEIAASGSLDLQGVMAVAPLGEDPRAAFDRLAQVSARLVADHPGATVISAGMSGDLEAAVAAGATHLRVGAALLGRRTTTG